VVAVRATAGEGQNKNVQVVAALGCMSWKHLHRLLRRETLHFHSAQMVGMGLRW